MPIPLLPRRLAGAAGLELIERWSTWRGDRLLPRRSDIDLPAIKRILPLVSLLEVRGPTEAIFRVAGSAFRDLLGYELTGLNYIDLVEPEQRAARAGGVRMVVGRPCGVCYVTTHTLPSGAVIPVEVMSLPVEGDRPGAPRLILSTNEALSDRREDLVEPAERLLVTAQAFDFIDIGAGVPALSDAA